MQKRRYVNDAHVLIVDSDRREAERLAAALAGAGHATHLAGSGLEALRRARGSADIDAVVAADALPDMPGLHLVRALKQRHEPAFLPGVLLSARDDVDARVARLLEGADECLPRGCVPAELVARVAAMVRIKRAQDELRREKDALERLSVTDPLTGLFNRRWFQHALGQEIERSRRQGHPLALALVDLDHFKRVNDRHGHDTGDRALQLAAELLKGQLRRVDVCTRWGGEEFALLLPATDRAGAAVVATRVLKVLRERAALEVASIAGEPPARVRLTASLGVAVFPSPELDGPDALFRAADTALYRAKQTGRDRACLAWESARPSAGPMVLDPRPACA
ncbi:MAG TPA: diguanylate cyclase [Anaeromyxobacteraceae bacterium]|nr:diguanylate cyclase [Anaeromyxobacteraceae bacterium]